MFVVALAFASVSLHAQSATTSTVTGVVSDSTGAVVPNAKVELTDIGTSGKTSTTTGSDGGYTFASVKPGNYHLTVSAKGFRQAVVNGLKVEVGKSALINLVLEIGAVTEVVEVTAGAAVELQTLNSSVGDVLDANMLSNMPTLSRDATALMLLQPMAIPGFNGPGGQGEGNSGGGTVAGARMDQNTFMLDGGDATSNMEGGGGYNSGFVATPRAVIPTPVESLEEFRVQTNNAGTDFSRSIGAEVQMVTIRGTNSWHGAGYWYHQNDELNANDWFRARRVSAANPNGTPNPEWRDNRYGGKIGGPIWKNRTFFFVLEEERHFFTQSTWQRLMPTAALRAGIVKFKDASGVVRAYNLNPIATLDPQAGPTDNDPRVGQMIPGTGLDSVSGNPCDIGSSATCTLANSLDPRNIGLSSAIQAEWANMPLPNDFTGGDRLRSAFFTSTVPNITNEHDAVVRLDHKINDKWDFNGSYRYSTSSIAPPNIQEDISGVAKGCQKGTPCELATRPLQPRYLVAGLTGRITPSLVNEFHFDWLRHWWAWIAPGARTPAGAQLAGESDTPLQVWSESRINGMVPINVNTQQARQRVWNGQDYTFNDNLSWIRGKHIFSFGGRTQRQNLFHVRDDKVVGGITTPLYFVVRGGQFNNDLGGFGAFRPPDCSPGSTTDTNCLPVTAGGSTQHSQWNQAYTSALGMVAQASQVLTRAPNFDPNPPGKNITQREIVDAYEIYFGDTWHLKPSLTLTYGLIWGVQMPPFDPNGTTTMMVDTGSGQIITAGQLLNARKLAGLNGNVVNPTVGFVPIKATGRKYPYDPDFSNFGPRLAAAWNPSFTDGFLGKFFGNKKTVLRGGWSRAFERKNGVGLVLTPALGLGFGDLSACLGPLNAAAAAAIGQSKGFCSGFGNPTTAFRIGSNADGNHVTVPALPVVSGGVIIPGNNSTIIPAGANSGFEPKDDRLDPRLQVGSSDSIDVTLQRELPGKMVLEVGYVFRKARDLYGNIDLNSVPYMFRPKGGGGQSFAQAFDAVAGQLQAGNLPLLSNGMANPAFPTQPALEALLGGLTSPLCSGAASAWGRGGAAGQAGLVGSFGSCTQAVAMYDQVNGNPYWPAHGAGALFSLVEPFLVTGPWLASNTQVGAFDWTMSNTNSNYNAGFVTLRSRAYHGLTFDVNYTLGHSLDNQGLTQECTGIIPDAYNPSRSYAPSLFDRRHTFNLLVNYELPFGKGKGMATGAVTDRLLGGWSISGVYVAASGLPDMLYDDAACFSEYGAQSANGNDTGLIPLRSGVINMTRNNNPNIGPNGYGSSSTGGVPNMFQNPDAVAAAFRHSTFSDARLGFGALRGPFRWNVDLAVGKKTRITERISTRFDVQFVNAFNHPMFGSGTDSYFANQPGADLSFASAFGVPSNQFNAPRYIQIGLRFDF
jgi:hypothetical protein